MSANNNISNRFPWQILNIYIIFIRSNIIVRCIFHVYINDSMNWFQSIANSPRQQLKAIYCEHRKKKKHSHWWCILNAVAFDLFALRRKNWWSNGKCTINWGNQTLWLSWWKSIQGKMSCIDATLIYLLLLYMATHRHELFAPYNLQQNRLYHIFQELM